MGKNGLNREEMKLLELKAMNPCNNSQYGKVEDVADYIRTLYISGDMGRTYIKDNKSWEMAFGLLRTLEQDGKIRLHYVEASENNEFTGTPTYEVIG